MFDKKELETLAKTAKQDLMQQYSQEAQDKTQQEEHNQETVQTDQQNEIPQEQENEQIDYYKDLFDDEEMQQDEEIKNTSADEEYDTPQYDGETDLSDIKLENSTDEEIKDLPKISPYDEPLFAGGPTKSQIQLWKKEWAGYNIYLTEILDKTFIFRTLNRYEYKQLISFQDLDALQREEIICQTVTLYPEGYNWKDMITTAAGIPSKYAQIIMEKSGFTDDYAIQVI